MYQIRKGVPVPTSTKAGKRGRNAKYPFREMKPGDSFVVPVKGEKAERVALRVSQAAFYAKRTTGRKFTVRNLGKSVAAWRVA